MSNIIETSPTSRGYASRHLRKSAIKARVNNTKRPRPPPPSSPAQSSTTATTIVQKHLPTVRLGDVLHKHPNLFTNGNKRGSKIHAANKHIAHIDRLAERYTQVKILYLGGNDLTTTMGFQQFSNLATLSLSNNLLSNMSDIYVLAGACPTLRNVSLEGNDITQTPYYRERVIAAMPELEALDGKKVLDQELRDAVDVEAKYAKSMNLLFQNDCLIHKLKRVSRQISLHSDLHAVKHGLRRGSIGSKIPITLLRTIDALSSGGGRGGGAKASTDVLSIDNFCIGGVTLTRCPWKNGKALNVALRSGPFVFIRCCNRPKTWKTKAVKKTPPSPPPPPPPPRTRPLQRCGTKPLARC